MGGSQLPWGEGEFWKAKLSENPNRNFSTGPGHFYKFSNADYEYLSAFSRKICISE